MANLLLTLFPAVAAAISLMALLVVVVRARQDNRKLPPGCVAPGADPALALEISRLAERIDSLETVARQAPVTPGRLGMNLTKRTQALRQHRLGQAAENIAKNLEMPKAEVELLLKVQQLTAR